MNNKVNNPLIILLLTQVITFIACTNSKGENVDSQIDSADLYRDVELVITADSLLTIAFYNVENLFDIYDDPDTEDDQFLPESEKQWTLERYEDKLQKLNKVLAALSTEANDPIDLLGLVEVENRQVMLDLIAAGNTGVNYKVVHEESPDERGIDVGLIYNADVFNYISHQSLQVDFPNEPNEKTRDILYVKGQINGEDLHLFVNHWSSRRDGQKETEYKRLASANVVSGKIDEIRSNDSDPNIILMGDFNDYPDNISITEVIAADGSGDKPFYNSASLTHERAEEGSYNYRGDWGMLDQIILSKELKNSQSIVLNNDQISIFKEDWMLFQHPKYKDFRPNRSYGGNKYYGGYSDHLPVYLQFRLN